MRMWRNWQTRRFQVPVGDHMGSSPFIRTNEHPFCGVLFSLVRMKGSTKNASVRARRAKARRRSPRGLRLRSIGDTLHPHHDWTVILIQEKYQNYRLFYIKTAKSKGLNGKLSSKSCFFCCAYFFLRNQIVKIISTLYGKNLKIVEIYAIIYLQNIFYKN